jgi:hypothetical protein
MNMKKTISMDRTLESIKEEQLGVLAVLAALAAQVAVVLGQVEGEQQLRVKVLAVLTAKQWVVVVVVQRQMLHLRVLAMLTAK